MHSLGSRAIDQSAGWDSAVLDALYRLAFASPDREVAGVLVGDASPGASAAALPFVRAAIPATQGFVPGQASSFIHQTWAQVHQTMALQYAGLETVGWYISRPGHGTALAQADVINHARWFARPDQILLVVDSRSRRAAIYGWSGTGLRQLHEGPVARRYTRAPRPGFPGAGVALLTMLGVTIGTVLFLLAQAIGG
jgi:hypothetical protein